MSDTPILDEVDEAVVTFTVAADADVYEAFGLTVEPDDVARRVRRRLAARVAAAVRERGWTQSEAAEHLDLHQPEVSRILRGKVEKTSADKLIVVLAKLGDRVDLLLDKALA